MGREAIFAAVFFGDDDGDLLAKGGGEDAFGKGLTRCKIGIDRGGRVTHGLEDVEDAAHVFLKVVEDFFLFALGLFGVELGDSLHDCSRMTSD